jgi:hypothetical protein
MKHIAQVVYPQSPGAETLRGENDMQGAELRVYDVTGLEVVNFKVQNSKEELDVTGLSSGMYVIIAEKQGRFARAKLVVE